MNQYQSLPGGSQVDATFHVGGGIRKCSEVYDILSDSLRGKNYEVLFGLLTGKSIGILGEDFHLIAHLRNETRNAAALGFQFYVRGNGGAEPLFSEVFQRLSYNKTIDSYSAKEFDLPSLPSSGFPLVCYSELEIPGTELSVCILDVEKKVLSDGSRLERLLSASCMAASGAEIRQAGHSARAGKVAALALSDSAHAIAHTHPDSGCLTLHLAASADTQRQIFSSLTAYSRTGLIILPREEQPKLRAVVGQEFSY